MQNLRLHLDLLNQKLRFNKILWKSMCTLKFEKHSSKGSNEFHIFKFFFYYAPAGYLTHFICNLPVLFSFCCLSKLT